MRKNTVSSQSANQPLHKADHLSAGSPMIPSSHGESGSGVRLAGAARGVKRAAVFLAALMICTSAPQALAPAAGILVAEAHSGRTDANGGHRDNKNASGLGSYHYHCGGYPAHLHPNGVCPYTGSGAASGSRSGGSGSSGGQSGAAGSAAAGAGQASKTAVPQEILDNLSLIFDARYYADHNPDLYQAYGYDEAQLQNHFLTCGMKEGRQACETFQVSVYKDNNPDLVQAYGDDWPSYYNHYVTCGHGEGRVCH